MKKIKILIFYIVLFFVFVVWGLIQPLNLDEVWNYGFAHNIYSGLIPYKDFNMVLTPFFSFIMSLGFHIFGSNILVLHIENAIMLVIMTYLLKKLIGKNYILVILFLVFPLSITFPSYNIFIFFILVLLIYLEKNNKNDYLIGIVLGLGILTKQSVGLCMVLPSLFYIKDFKKIIKRLVGCLIPLSIFLIYLIATKSLFNFIDLCFLGLFDFAGENHRNFNIFYVIFIIFIVLYLYVIKKNKKSISNYYCLSFIAMMVPLFDTYHTQVTFLSFLLFIFLNYNIDFKVHLNLLFFGVIIGISVILLTMYYKKIVYPNDINHFEYKFMTVDDIEFTKEISEFVSENSDKNIVYVNSNGYYIKLVNDIPINYLDLINKGNWGYNGSDKLLKQVKSVDNAIFILDKNELSKLKQTDKEIIKYVIKNGRKIDSIRIYDIYVFD